MSISRIPLLERIATVLTIFFLKPQCFTPIKFREPDEAGYCYHCWIATTYSRLPRFRSMFSNAMAVVALSSFLLAQLMLLQRCPFDHISHVTSSPSCGVMGKTFKGKQPLPSNCGQLCPARSQIPVPTKYLAIFTASFCKSICMATQKRLFAKSLTPWYNPLQVPSSPSMPSISATRYHLSVMLTRTCKILKMARPNCSKSISPVSKHRSRSSILTPRRRKVPFLSRHS